MKHKAWFRLIVKLLGMVFALIGLGVFGLGSVELVLTLLRSETISWYRIDGLLYGMPFILIGLYLVFGGRWIADRAFPSGPNCCPGCGYQVRGNVSGVCSECGMVLPAEFKGEKA